MSILEKDSLRPHVANLTRNTEAVFTIEGQQSAILDLKCQRWLFMWPDRRELCSRKYVMSMYADYLDTLQVTYHQVKANIGLTGNASGVDVNEAPV
jgi:hypothetical protein